MIQLGLFLSFYLAFGSPIGATEKEMSLPALQASEEQLDSPPLPSYTPFIRNAQGLVLAGSKSDLLDPNELEDVCGICFFGLKVPTGRKLQQRLAPLVMGQSIDIEQVSKIKRAIHKYYQEEGCPFIEISLPEQDITSNIFQLIVIEGRLGDVNVEGSRYLPASYFEKNISLSQGDPLDMNRLMMDLNFFNQNPFRRVDAIYQAGKTPGTTDVTLMIKDIRPFRFYLGSDNNGVQALDRLRYLAGISAGKIFGLDHVFTYQYTTSANFKRFQAHTVQYSALTSWHHVIDVYGGYSSLYSAILPFPTGNNRGQSGQASLRYKIPCKPNGAVNSAFQIGYDYKITNNSYFFSSYYEPYRQNVNLTQFVFIYQGDFEGGKSRLNWIGELFYSPGPWLPNQTNTDYEQLRPGAKNKYIYTKFSFRYLQRLPKNFSSLIWLRGQWSSQNLLPSEQYGLGGYDTVRGYEERQISMDNGFNLNYELRTPPLAVISRRAKKDALEFLLFFDYGYGNDKNPIPSESQSSFLMGAGPGFRYTYDPWISARLDWGFKWHSKTDFGGGGSMFHFSFILNL